MPQLRIAYGRISQETNAFSPVLTTIDDFERFHYLRGSELAHACGRRGEEVAGLTRAAELSGFVAAAGRFRDAEVATVPLFSAWAMPSGPLSAETQTELERRLAAALSAVGPLDGLMLSLHGAMRGASEDCAEPEERFLAAAREVVGPRVPIAVTLDLHAQLTPAKVEGSDILVGYRTNPHRDLARAGRRAGALLLAAATGRVHPVTRWRTLPMVLGGGTTIEFLPPMLPLFWRMKAMERSPRVLSVSLFMCHIWNDSPQLGWSCHVTTDGDPELADRLADELAERAWAVRHQQPPGFLTTAEAVARARRWRLARRLGTVCLVDTSDVVGAGATGENTNLIGELLEHAGGLTTYVPLRDPVAVAELWPAAPGEPVEVQVGGRLDPERNPALELRGRMRGRHQTRYFGRAVVIEIDELKLVLTELPPLPLKPTFYSDLGLDPWRADLCVVKTLFHYRIYWLAVARRSLLVRTRGASDLDLVSTVQHQDPVHPLHPVADWRATDRRRRLSALPRVERELRV
jgi:microcystin degradation protein MlrC